MLVTFEERSTEKNNARTHTIVQDLPPLHTPPINNLSQELTFNACVLFHWISVNFSSSASINVCNFCPPGSKYKLFAGGVLTICHHLERKPFFQNANVFFS